MPPQTAAVRYSVSTSSLFPKPFLVLYFGNLSPFYFPSILLAQTDLCISILLFSFVSFVLSNGYLFVVLRISNPKALSFCCFSGVFHSISSKSYVVFSLSKCLFFVVLMLFLQIFKLTRSRSLKGDAVF